MSAMPAPASDHQRLLAGALAALAPWERNFLRLLTRAGPESVIVELGSMSGRPREAERYGKLGSVADVERVRTAIADKLRARAQQLAAEPQREPSPPPPPAPAPVPVLDEVADEPAVLDEPSPVVEGDLDDFGQARPTSGWGATAAGMLVCAECGARFWPTGPSSRFCPDHRVASSRSEEPAPICDVCDHLLPEDGSPCSYCARELAEVQAALTPPTGIPAAPARDPLVDSVLALLMADARSLRDEFAPRLTALERQVDALAASVEQLRGMVDASGLDALDITLGAAVAGLARIGRGEMTPGQLLLDLHEGATDAQR